MTVIACDGKIMACDGWVTSGDTVLKKDCIKIVKTEKGIFGVSGSYESASQYLKWCVEGEKKKLKIEDDNFEAIFLNNEGLLFHMDKHIKNHMRVEVPFEIGLGSEIAYGALMYGATSFEAVEIVIKRNIYCGGQIMVLKSDHV